VRDDRDIAQAFGHFRVFQSRNSVRRALLPAQSACINGASRTNTVQRSSVFAWVQRNMTEWQNLSSKNNKLCAITQKLTVCSPCLFVQCKLTSELRDVSRHRAPPFPGVSSLLKLSAPGLSRGFFFVGLV
jgi:hypothetical protein